MKTKTAILILAAGSSSRMGQPKQLLPYKSTSLLGNIIQESLNSNARKVFVVLGANSQEIKSKIDFNNVEVIENNEWNKGIGSSIACGVRFIESNTPKINSVLITLADQPFIVTSYFNNIISCFFTSEKKIVATKIGERLGVPAIFHSAYFKDLKKLNEDKGAKELILSNLKDVEIVTSKIDFTDIDTMENYYNLKEGL